MNNFYKQKIAFDIMYGSILKEDQTGNLFYNCRKLDKSFLFPDSIKDEELKQLIQKSLTDHHDYIYELVKDSPATNSNFGFVY